jgi:hypothetical protein
MSPREKKLLIFFATAGFIVLNFAAYGWYAKTNTRIAVEKQTARTQLDTAEMFRISREQVLDEMDWLAEHEPEPAAYQDVQTSLQQLAEREARATGLTIKSQKLLPTDTTSGVHYHRAKVQLNVTGSEEALYQWFFRIKSPEEFRSATHIRISPNREDDTMIDCIADIEQWFIPLPQA